MSTAQPTLDNVWRLFQETDRKFQETGQLLREQSQATEKKINALEKLDGLVDCRRQRRSHGHQARAI